MAWSKSNLYSVGGLNGLFQFVGEVLMPVRKKTAKILGMNRQSLGFKFVQIIITFVFVDFAWIFFRATNVTEGIEIIKSILTVKNPWVLWNGDIYKCGLDSKNFSIMVICILILFVVDFMKKRGISIRAMFLQQDIWFQSVAIAVVINLIMLFGIWGPGYNEASFIYFQF